MADLLRLDTPDEDLDEEEKIKRRKRRRRKNDPVFGKLKMKILNNIPPREYTSEKPKYDLSESEHPFALGITFDESSMQKSADEKLDPRMD